MGGFGFPWWPVIITLNKEILIKLIKNKFELGNKKKPNNALNRNKHNNKKI